MNLHILEPMKKLLCFLIGHDYTSRNALIVYLDDAPKYQLECDRCYKLGKIQTGTYEGDNLTRKFKGYVIMEGDNIPGTEEVEEWTSFELETEMYDWLHDAIAGKLGKEIVVAISIKEEN